MMPSKTPIRLLALLIGGLFLSVDARAEVDLLKLSPLEEGIYVDPKFEGGVAKIGAEKVQEWLQLVHVVVIKDDQSTYWTGQSPIFEPKPVDFWLYHATEQLRRGSPALISLRLVSSDPKSISGFLGGQEFIAEFIPGAEL